MASEAVAGRSTAWGTVPKPDLEIEVTPAPPIFLVGERSDRRPLARLLDGRDGISCSPDSELLVDLAGAVHPRRTARAVDNCLAAGSVTYAGLVRTFDDMATRGRKGIAAMREILEERQGDYVAPASELEARFLELVSEAGLPEPVRQLDAGDANDWIGRVDFAYPQLGLLIELDGRRHHSALLDREADRQRDERLLAGGWRAVARLGWTEVVERPELGKRRLRGLLGAA